MLRALLRSFCARYKHWVLLQAHGQPTHLEVFAGKPGSLVRRIVSAVLRDARIHPDRLTYYPDANDLEEPRMWLDHDDPAVTRNGIRGWTAVCRYVGHLSRSYPVHPVHAAYIDSSLHDLDGLVRYVASCEADGFDAFLCTGWRASVEALEARLDDNEGDEVWLEHMGSPSLADACWFAALEWLEAHNAAITDDAFPNVQVWLAEMRGE